MTNKILITDDLSSQGLAKLETNPHIEFEVVKGLTPETLAQRIPGYDGLIVRSSVKVTAKVLAAADKLCNAFKQPFQILGTEIDTRASIGIAVYPDHGRDAPTLLRKADEAMYAAKAAAAGPQLYQPPTDAGGSCD